jgi:hypothetical protein
MEGMKVTTVRSTVNAVFHGPGTTRILSFESKEFFRRGTQKDFSDVEEE